VSNSFGNLSFPSGDETDVKSMLGSPRAASSPIEINPPINQKKNSYAGKKEKIDSLKIAVINFQSIKAKREAFHMYIETHSPDIIIGTESWMDECVNNNEIFPPEFSAVRKDRNSRGGGVFVATRKNIITVHQMELDFAK
jgi:hypothetical protein